MDNRQLLKNESTRGKKHHVFVFWQASPWVFQPTCWQRCPANPKLVRTCKTQAAKGRTKHIDFWQNLQNHVSFPSKTHLQSPQKQKIQKQQDGKRKTQTHYEQNCNHINLQHQENHLRVPKKTKTATKPLESKHQAQFLKFPKQKLDLLDSSFKNKS